MPSADASNRAVDAHSPTPSTVSTAASLNGEV